jgi:serine O-acetyltransferase
VNPISLWRLSDALYRRGHRRLALLVKKVNSAIYHNSLSPGAEIGPGLRFGHHGFGTVIHSNVTIGSGVTIWHNVTIAVRAATPDPHRIYIEDDVMIGANSVIISPLKGSLRIGRGARIGAGAVVFEDIPPGATVVSQPPRVIPAREEREAAGAAHEPDARPDGQSGRSRAGLVWPSGDA